jgi:hypothetical protein
MGYIAERQNANGAVAKIAGELDYLRRERVVKRRLELATCGCLRCLRRYEKLLQGEWV